ncbi:hypothetical protein U9M48_022172, partial [Paspalum notatum var. saurae]
MAINKEVDMDPPIFRRMYICWMLAKNGSWLDIIASLNEQQVVSFYVLLEETITTRCTPLLGLQWTKGTMITGTSFVTYYLETSSIITVQKWAPEAKHRNLASTSMPIGRRNSMIKSGKRCSRLVQKPQTKSCSTELVSNYDYVDNNICESFNKWIVEARGHKILMASEMEHLYTSFNKGAICPNISKKRSCTSNCNALSNGADKFEVRYFDHRFTVDLAKKRMLIIKKYNHCLEPVEGMESLSVSDMPKLRALGYIRMRGRPKNERRRKCKGVGHNIASCDKRNAASGAVTNHTPASNQESQHTNQSAAGSWMAIIHQIDTMAGNNIRKRQHSLTLIGSQDSVATTSTVPK